MDVKELSLLSHFNSAKNIEETNDKINQLSNVVGAQYPHLQNLLPRPQKTQQQLRNQVYKDLEYKWTNLRIPTQTAATFVQAHKVFNDQQVELETARLRRVNQIVIQARANQNNPGLSAEDLGYSNQRQPVQPARHYTVKDTDGCLYGILPDTGGRSAYPLVFNDKITEELINTCFIFLPSSNFLDLVNTIYALFKRGPLLGFSRANYSTSFKVIIRKFFSEYHNIVSVTDDPDTVFQGLLTICKSYDIESKLTEALRLFKRKVGQSFPEFGTLLYNIVSRIVSLVFLSFTEIQVQNFSEERLLENIRFFVSSEVYTVLDSYIKSSTSNKYHSWFSVCEEIYKIESFMKVRIIERNMPQSLYLAVTTDRTRDPTMLFQALTLQNARPPSRPNSPQSQNPRARSLVQVPNPLATKCSHLLPRPFLTVPSRSIL